MTDDGLEEGNSCVEAVLRFFLAASVLKYWKIIHGSISALMDEWRWKGDKNIYGLVDRIVNA